MNDCDNCQHHLDEFVLGELDESLQREIENHICDCPRCAAAVRKARNEWALVPMLLSVQAPRPRVWRAIQNRVALSRSELAEAQASSLDVENPTPMVAEKTLAHSNSTIRWLKPLISYSAAASILVGTILAFRYGTLGLETNSTYAENTVLEPPLDDLEMQQAFHERLRRSYGSPDVKFVSIRGPKIEVNDPRAFLVWDALAGQCHFFAMDLPRPDSGLVYVLWIIHAHEGQRQAIILPEPKNGQLAAVVDLPPGDTQCNSIMVTLETTQNPNEPSSEIVLAGDFLSGSQLGSKFELEDQ